jgi:hypothetical protein
MKAYWSLSNAFSASLICRLGCRPYFLVFGWFQDRVPVLVITLAVLTIHVVEVELVVDISGNPHLLPFLSTPLTLIVPAFCTAEVWKM